ncbi:cache domain-containing protein [Lentisphaerota bacterium ZTH]|nr:cache domain-containing protein [Lentisphaerota bacterium]WET06936.1 cache domain-containing protein [Lentisphaerota bacterium ZTH]
MKFRTQISIISILLLSATSAINLYVAVQDIKHQGAVSIKEIKEEYLEQIKTKLRNIVSCAYGVIEFNYNSINDREELNLNFGDQLKAAALQQIVALNKQKRVFKTDKIVSPEKFKVKCSMQLPQVFPTESFVYSPENIAFSDQLIGKIELKMQVSKFGFVYSPGSNIALYSYYVLAPDMKHIIVCSLSRKYVTNYFLERGKDVVRNMSFEHGNGYLFINDMQARNVVHPLLPYIEGWDYSKIPDSTGNFHVPEMVEVCKQFGSGYLTYYWPKPERTQAQNSRSVQKLSYVRLFKPLGWIIGTGEYIDDILSITSSKELEIRAQVDELIYKVLAATVIVMAIMISLVLIFSNAISEQIGWLIKRMRSLNLKDLNTKFIELRGFYEIKELSKLFNRLLRSLNDGIRTIREATAVKERLESNLRIAEDIRERVLIHLDPIIDMDSSLDIFGDIVLGKNVGAEFYDIFYIDEEHFCFACGSVAQKGINATLLMAITKTILRAKAVPGLTTGEIFSEINRTLCLEKNTDIGVDLLMCIYNLNTHELMYSCANISPPCVLSGDGSSKFLTKRHGPPLGINPKADYGESTEKIARGDKLIVYHINAMLSANKQGERFGRERFMNMLHNTFNLDSRATVHACLDELMAFVDEEQLSDDQAMLVFRHLPDELQTDAETEQNDPE